MRFSTRTHTPKSQRRYRTGLQRESKNAHFHLPNKVQKVPFVQKPGIIQRNDGRRKQPLPAGRKSVKKQCRSQCVSFFALHTFRSSLGSLRFFEGINSIQRVCFHGRTINKNRTICIDHFCFNQWLRSGRSQILSDSAIRLIHPRREFQPHLLARRNRDIIRRACRDAVCPRCTQLCFYCLQPFARDARVNREFLCTRQEESVTV